MPKVSEVCHVVRSKVAGPFWVTMDLMFNDREAFDRYSNSPAIGADAVAKIYGVDADQVKLYPVPDLNVLKISFPRQTPQGSVGERDLHSGQQYTFILNEELG